ncbi:MAG: zinc-dependent metalloprotease, partial [Verrucomicrobiota bacterium]
LSNDRTRFLESKSFPDNTLFRIQYVFENLHPAKSGESDVADSRFVTIKVQHTLMAMPENDYEPRFEDARVGYFTTQVTDLTSQSSAPYRDFIHRWHLKKKNPNAAKSKPVEPLVWWIENTTPLEFRDTIRNGILAWNLAFESAGFIDAIEVKVQPDDAEWDADDVRYHVVRWTSSPNPPFGGYGPSFANPRTGQILGADVMLEYIFVTNRIRRQEIVKLGSLTELPMPELPGIMRGHFCQFRDCLHSNRIAAGAFLQARASRFGNGPVEMTDIVSQSLTDLTIHEIGHTLGLNHNFKASQLYDRKQIHDKELTSKTGLTGSIMEYSPINLALDPEDQGHYYSLVPGPYDHWAIRFGYADADELDEILAESTLPKHRFANDADDMRSPGRGIDPRAMINDLTSEPIEHAVDQITRVKMTLPKLAEQYPVDGESYQELRTAFSSLMREYERAAIIMSRFVGGVHVDRSVVGQEGAANAPFVPVAAEEQSKAVAQLEKHLFGPGALVIPDDLIARLQMQRRGFEFFDLDANEDPKVHERILDIQSDVLNQLLHRKTLARIIDTGLYGNEYDLETFMTSLDGAIMDGDPADQVDSFREALQIEYIDRLIEMSGLKGDSSYPAAARSQAILLLESRVSDDQPIVEPFRHHRHLMRVIGNALEAK